MCFERIIGGLDSFLLFGVLQNLWHIAHRKLTVMLCHPLGANHGVHTPRNPPRIEHARIMQSWIFPKIKRQAQCVQVSC